jgi:hypothetical protein
MFDRGFWTVFRWRNSPVRLHWSLPLSALLFSRFRFEPAAWLGLLVLVLVHELGHGLLVRRYRLEVASIDLHGLGGECRYLGFPSEWQVSVIAWGGVLAQAVLLPVGFLVAPHIHHPFLATMVTTFAWTNIWMIGFNLLPIPPLDGADAWKLFGLWRQSRRELKSYLSARAAMQKQRGRTAKATSDAGKVLRTIERHDEVPEADLELPDEVAEQVDRAVKRALNEHKERK